MGGEQRRFYGWQIATVSFVFMMIIVGLSVYGIPLYYNLWVADFGWTRAQVQLGNTISKLIIGPVLGFLAGWLIDRRGPRGIMAAGALFAVTALIGFSLIHDLRQAYLFFFFNALGYLCAGPLPNQVLLSHWFSRMRGRVMGLAYVGVGVGGMLVPWVIFALNRQFGWRVGFRIIGVLVGVVLLSLLTVVRRRPEDVGALPDGADIPPPRVPGGETARVSQVLATPSFWLLAVGSILSIGAIGGVMQNLALYLADILPKAEVELTKTTIASLALLFSVAGRIVMGWLADRYPKKNVMLATYALVSCAIPLLVLARTVPALLYVFAVVFGFALGADYMLIPLMAAECFGLAALSRVLGLIVMSDGVGEATSPYFVAYLRDHTGSYSMGFLLLSAVALLGAAAILGVRSPARARETAVAPGR